MAKWIFRADESQTEDEARRDYDEACRLWVRMALNSVDVGRTLPDNAKAGRPEVVTQDGPKHDYSLAT